MKLSLKNYLFCAKKTWANPLFWFFFIAPCIWGGYSYLPMRMVMAVLFFPVVPVLVMTEVYYKNP